MKIGRIHIIGCFPNIIKALLSLLPVLFLLSACNITKNIPPNQYLLDKVDLIIDNKDIDKAGLTSLIKQVPNDPKFRIAIYNWAKSDSSWLKRNFGKAGKPPVIYDMYLTSRTVKELHAELINKGYLNNEVTASVDTSGKKAAVTYKVIANEPYRIRNYNIDITDRKIDSILVRRKRAGRSVLSPGTIFDMDKLEDEQNRISRTLRNRGYYASTVDNLHYLADTMLQSKQVDLSLILRDSSLARPYYIRNVSVISGYDPIYKDEYKIVDSLNYKGLKIYYDSTRFMQPKMLYNNILIRKGALYNENYAMRSYNYLNSLGSIGRVNIQFDEVNHPDSSLLDCSIYLTPGNIHGIELGLDGTNKAGDLGVATNIAYTHHNIFNGAEALNIKLRGAYEFVSGNTNALTHNFYEFGISTGLAFPQTHIPFIGSMIRQRYNINTEYQVSFDIQKRPEYTREFFNFSWKNRWENDSKTLSQTLNLLDVNYVLMPWVSDTMRVYLNNDSNSLTKFSYEDVFTAGISYNVVYTNPNRGLSRQNLYTIRFNAESSGNLLNGIFSLSEARKSATGQYNILGNPFAQYIKGDIGYTQTTKLNDKNSIAFHLMAGAAYPYGNSTVIDTVTGKKSRILPFEKRYYSGGPNSVRGWNTRRLGPGSYNGEDDNPANHVGDIKLEFSFEYRYKWIKWLEFALFADAGNIWTISDYNNQAGGQFDINRFYKEIAIGTGFGFRLDLNFLIIRIDAAKRVYDPAKEEGKRWTFLSEGLKGNSGVYVAIGYPF